MEINQLFEKYRRRLSQIGLRKAFFWGLAFGFACEFIAALAIWFLKLKVWLAVLIMLAVVIVAAVAATALIYTLFFKPTEKKIARLIDGLGLEERLVTMCEHENDDRFIAELQRRDAREKLSVVDENRFVFRFSRVAAIVLSITVALGVAMSTISTLSSGGVIPNGTEFFAPDSTDPDNIPPEEDSSACVVIYVAGDGGIIEGEAIQRLIKGQDTTPVTAVPDVGYDFVGWTDGDPRATRVDYAVSESMTVTAKFAKKVEVEVPEGGGVPGGDGGSEGEVPGGDVGLGGGAGGSGNSGEMEGDDINGDAGGGAGAMKDKEDNTVLDGYTNYKYEFDYEAEIEALLNDDTLPDEVKDYLYDYLDALKQMQDSEQ